MRASVKETRRDALLRKLFGLHDSTTGSSASTLPRPIAVHTANDPRASSGLSIQSASVRNSDLNPDDISIFGAIYDVRSGELREVVRS